jgi:hypothetical protein
MYKADGTRMRKGKEEKRFLPAGWTGRNAKKSIKKTHSSPPPIFFIFPIRSSITF